MRTLWASTMISVACGLVAGCGAVEGGSAAVDLTTCAVDRAGTRLNEIQSIGSHNSYKIAIPEAELVMIRLSSDETADALDYGHLPLAEQLDLGMRQLELDVFYDPDGGRYGDPLLPRLSGEPFDAAGLEAPGFKVLHVQDVDARSHCVSFVTCLQEIETWSAQHPDHVPILILVNAKQQDIDVPGATSVLPFDEAAFARLDAEIFTVVAPGDLIVPDDVRGNAPTLREAILSTGWPRLEASRGKILFALDEGPGPVATYLRGTASLDGLAMFVNSLSERADHAAYFTLNDPLVDGARIQAKVEQGFVVRTRADADTAEARTGDTTRRDAALASGAQYVSTDYYQPRAKLSDYAVSLPGGGDSRCNRISTRVE